MEAGRVVSIWETTVGDALAGHTEPVSFREGVLSVAVDSSAWLFQLERFHKKLVRDKLNKELGRPLVKKIIFRFGEMEKNSGTAK